MSRRKAARVTMVLVGMALLASAQRVASQSAPTLSTSATAVQRGQTISLAVTATTGQFAAIAVSRFSFGFGRYQGQDVFLGSDMTGLAGGFVGPDGRYVISAQVLSNAPSGSTSLQAAVADDLALTQNVRLTNPVRVVVGLGHPGQNQVTATINVGLTPVDIRVSSQGGQGERGYVVNRGSNSVSVIDVATKALVTSVPVGPGPVAVYTFRNFLYVTNQGSSLSPGNSISAIDMTTNQVVGTYRTGLLPDQGQPNLDGSRLYVANTGETSVTAIDRLTGMTVATVPLPATPSSGLTAQARGDRVYVVLPTPPAVAIIDQATHTVTKMITVGSNPQFPFELESLRRLYVANQGSNTVSVIDLDTESLLTTIPVGRGPVNARTDLPRNRVYVENRTDGTISVIDATTNQVIRTVSVGRNSRLRVSPDGQRIFAQSLAEGKTYVVDADSLNVIATVPVGANPIQERFSSDGSKAFIVNRNDGTVSVIE